MMKNYLSFYDDEEIRDEVYDYIFSFCNQVKCLMSSLAQNDSLSYTLVDKKIYLYETNRKFATEWGMRGEYVTFKLNNFVKNILKQCNLESGFVVEKDAEYVLFSNITLLNNDKLIYSCCTHEGYIEFDKELKHNLPEFCFQTLKTTKTYNEMKTIFLNLKKEYNSSAISEICDKLSYLHCYVEKAHNSMIRQSSVYDDEMTWSEYLNLASKSLTKKTYAELSGAGSFENLYTIQENKYRNKNTIFQFINCPLSKSIRRELSFLTLFC